MRRAILLLFIPILLFGCAGAGSRPAGNVPTAESPRLQEADWSLWPDEGYFDGRERAALRFGLETLGLIPSDLGFDKRPVFNERTILEYGRRLPLVDLALDHPLLLPGVCESFGLACGQIDHLVAGHALLLAAREGTLAPRRADAPQADPIGLLMQETEALAAMIESAWTTPALAPLRGRSDLANVAGDSLVAAFDAWSAAVPSAAIRSLLLALDEAARTSEPGPSAQDRPAHPAIDGDLLLVRETAAGLLIVGGRGPNRYAAGLEAAFLYDLGGDDVYACAVASADSLHPVSWCLDAGGGNDTYLDPGSPTQAAALCGVAVLLDCGGDDFYRCGDIGQGAALLGTAIFADYEGDDVYVGGEMVQAFAAGGDALLLDRSGNDSYRADRFAQASGTVLGVALLADQAGNDTYHAGGRFPHAPLLPDHYQSFSQGFSIGERHGPGGGVALLADGGGDDSYSADVFGIASGYWLSLGMLHDAGGNDSYKAHIYNMGAGVHLAAGILMDGAGDDTYTTGAGVAQGCGHDFSVGMLLDRRGDDRYLAGTGLSQGAADENSVALFLDSGGSDLHSCGADLSQGEGRPRYGAPSVALHLDLDGEHDFRALPGGASLRVSEGLGLRAAFLATTQEPPIAAGSTDRLAIEDDTFEGLWGYAGLWQVGRNEWAVHESRRRLIEQGAEAVSFIVAEKMGETNIYAIRAMHRIFGELQQISLEPLLGVLREEGEQSRRNAMEVLAGFGDPAVASLTLAYLSDADPAIVQHAIRIQGRHGNEGAIHSLVEILVDNTQGIYQRVAAATALGAIGGELATATLAEFVNPAADLPLRHACAYALGSSDAGRIILRNLERSSDAFTRIWASRGLSATN